MRHERPVTLSRAGWAWFYTLLFLIVFFTAIIVPPAVNISQQPPTPTPTTAPCQDEDYPAYEPGTIYLAKQDERGHWLVVETDNPCVARDEIKLGFYPVPAEYADEVRGR